MFEPVTREAIVTKTSARFTYQDYLLMGDDVRYELFEGDRFLVPAPDVNHQDERSRNKKVAMKDIHITVPDDVYQALDRAAVENALKPEDLLRVQIEKFVRTYNDETSTEVHEHIRATIEEYRDVLERLAT